MGRMLETLKLGSAAKPHAQDCVVDWSMREAEEVPYIEVGGGKKIEGSATVMAVKHPPQLPTIQPPHPATEKVLVAAPKLSNLTEARPMTVAFEPWPAGLAQARGIAPEVIAFHKPEHAISKEYAGLLDKMLEGHTGPGTQAVLLCGARSQVGTTTVLLNLAVVAAAKGKRRLALVDTHLSRPGLAQRLGLAPPAGLQEVLAGSAALEPALLKTLVAGLHLLAARAEDSAAAGPLSTKALAWLLSWLKDRFDLLLIDGPALDEPADLASLASLCDGAYLVVPKADAAGPHKTLAQSLARSGGRLKGMIHTHFEM